MHAHETLPADRGALLQALTHSLGHAQDSGELVGVILLKIQRLKDIRIEYGYDESDLVYEQFVGQLRGCLREKDMIARISNDEFALMLPGLKNPAQPVMAINKIQRTCGEPIEINGNRVKMKFAFGASVGPEDAPQAEALLRCADLALRDAETANVESVRYCDLEKTGETPVFRMENELERAISTGELVAHYQPIVDIETGRLTGAEMLSRWPDGPEGCAVDAATFIAVAEQSGLIVPLTRWALNNSLRECADWQNDLPNLPVSVNFSALALADPHLSEIVQSALNLWGADAGRLTVEITESSIMADPENCLRLLNHLHDAGVRIAIDDFGTGYSSLAYLKELPVDILKIDQSFVLNMTRTEADRRIVQAVIDLAHNFDLTVVAEGVEDEETLDTLTLMGCQRAQGYHVGRPMAAGDLASWFSASDWDPVEASATPAEQAVDFEIG